MPKGYNKCFKDSLYNIPVFFNNLSPAHVLCGSRFKVSNHVRIQDPDLNETVHLQKLVINKRKKLVFLNKKINYSCINKKYLNVFINRSGKLKCMLFF